MTVTVPEMWLFGAQTSFLLCLGGTFCAHGVHGASTLVMMNLVFFPTAWGVEGTWGLVQICKSIARGPGTCRTHGWWYEARLGTVLKKGGLIRLNFKLGTQGKNIPCYIITQGFWLEFMNMSRVQRGKKWVALNSKYNL